MAKSKVRTIVYDTNGKEKIVFENIALNRSNDTTDIFKSWNTAPGSNDVFYRLQVGESIIVERNKEE